ncbi:hypothetical protein FXO37_10856 [Capsicum annuum]|nr:hypothetical protein FXO37_10856 [Capsicum annuum]
MVSADGTFALGFFTPGNSTFSYLGIWYNTIPGQTVVWVANRESPIPQHSTAVFTIGDDGNLVLFDEKDKLIWSSNVSSTNSTIGALLDNGNLVLTHGEFNILWQSFEHPTDTFLPEMKIGYNGKTGKRIMINSWTSNEDPQPGNFSFGIDPEGRPRLYIFKQNSIHFRFDDTYEYLGGNLRGTAWYLSIVSRNDEVYLTYGYIKGWITLRVFVDPAGHLQVLFCTQYANKWKFIFQVPQTLCDIYAQCGPFGSCGGLTSELCMCLTGFKPKFSTDWDNGKWTDGCVRKVALGCDGKDRFLKYENMKLPDHTISFGHMSVNECETQCIRNCSCSAYAYLNSTCLIWIGDYWTLAATILMAEFSMFDFMALSQKIGEATNDFHGENKLGEGGFGPVFKGFLAEVGDIAIKRLSRRSSQGLEEFMNELKLIAKLQHKNLVSLLGCCVEGEEKILIYMSNCSLDKFLFDPSLKVSLNWGTRFGIIEGISQGMLYLHKYSRLKVIHRDLKASNILLDNEMIPKISDFGMARIFVYGEFSEKSDVFSFGVLLLEILSGQRNSDFLMTEISASLLGWAWNKWKEGRILELIDPSVRETCDSNKATSCILVALLCVQEIPIDRPTMPDIVVMLSNETMLIPEPKEPAFRSSWQAPQLTDVSINEMTVTLPKPR